MKIDRSSSGMGSSGGSSATTPLLSSPLLLLFGITIPEVKPFLHIRRVSTLLFLKFCFDGCARGFAFHIRPRTQVRRRCCARVASTAKGNSLRILLCATEPCAATATFLRVRLIDSSIQLP